jgi:hypothetical protein
MTWQQGGPTGITFQRAAGGGYTLEGRPEAERARRSSVGGPGMWRRLNATY